MTTLHHTTSVDALERILREGALKPKGFDGFVSFSETAVLHDIAAAEVTLVIERDALAEHLDRVIYSESWFDGHREQAGYIAGEGWREQFVLPDDLDWDAEEAEEAEEAAWRDGELDAFLAKSGEREHVSRAAGEPLPIPPAAIVAVVIQDDRVDADTVVRLLETHGVSAEIRGTKEPAPSL